MSALMTTEEFMTTGEAQKYLGVTNPTLREWAQEAGIQSYKGARNTTQYRKKDIELLYQRKVIPQPREND